MVFGKLFGGKSEGPTGPLTPEQALEQCRIRICKLWIVSSHSRASERVTYEFRVNGFTKEVLPILRKEFPMVPALADNFDAGRLIQKTIATIGTPNEPLFR